MNNNFHPTWTSYIKQLAGRLEGAHPKDLLVLEAAAALRALARERDDFKKLSETQENILANKLNKD